MTAFILVLIGAGLAFAARGLRPPWRMVLAIALALVFLTCLAIDHSPRYRFGYVLFLLLGAAAAVDEWRKGRRSSAG